MRKGFTIIELLAVLVILGIILMIAVPSIGGFTGITNRRRIESDAKTFEMLVRNKIIKDSSIEINGTGYFYLDSINKSQLNGTYSEKSYVIVSSCDYKTSDTTTINNYYSCSKSGVFLYDDSKNSKEKYSYERAVNETNSKIGKEITVKNKTCEDEETWCDVKSIMINDFKSIKEEAKLNIPQNMLTNEFFYFLVENVAKSKIKLPFGYYEKSYIKFDSSGNVVMYNLVSNKIDSGISSDKNYYSFENYVGFRQLKKSEKYSGDICKGEETKNGGCIKDA